MSLKFLILSAALILSGCSTLDTKERAINAQVADLGSTALGLSVPGIYETNPLGLLVIPAKYVAFQYAESLPINEKIEIHRQLSAFGWGATISNLCTIGIVLTGGTSSVPCFFIGLGTGIHDYRKTKPKSFKEEFDRFCIYKQKENPQHTCIWTEPTQ
jgi:hypothetical protein